jgi:hypothetical protein
MQKFLTTLAALAALSACTNPPPVAPMTDSGTPDMTDAGTTVDPCAAPVPDTAHPYGTSVGRSFRPLTLENCDGSGLYSFYGDNEWCEPDHRLTVVSIAGVWCVPCQMETAQFESRITAAYAGRGVRLIQVVVDGPVRGGGATLGDCQGWVSRYGLTNTELLDSGGAMTGPFFPSGSLPSTIIIDEEGIIRFYEDGVSVGLSTLTAEIDSLLAEP